MDEFFAARIRAAREVWAHHNYDPADPESKPPSPEYELRRIHRACCKILNMSLLQVQEMPLSELLDHYYEHIYAERAETEGEGAAEAWMEELQALIETDEEREKRLAAELVEKRSVLQFQRETEELNRRNEEKLQHKAGSSAPKRDEGGNGLGAMHGEALREAAMMESTFRAQADKLMGIAKKLGGAAGVSRRFSGE